MENYIENSSTPQQSGNIRNIVQLVQSGKLKVESNAPKSNADSGYEDDDNRSSKSDGSHASSKLTSESRWLLIKQLAHRKAQRLEAAAQGSGQQEAPSSSVNRGINDVNPIQDDYYSSETDSHLKRGPNQLRQHETSPAEQERFQGNGWLAKPQMSQSPPNYKRRSQSSDPRDRDSYYSSPSGTRQELSYSNSPHYNGPLPYDDGMSLSYVEDARTQRIAQNEAALRHEVYKECTFQPRLYTSEMSRSRNKDLETPFHQRVARWQSMKDAEINKRRQSINKSEAEQCTFRPQLNPNSLRAAVELRGGNLSNVSGDLSPEAIGDVATRLQKSYEESMQLRAGFIKQEEQRVIAEEKRSCTFQPNIATTHSKFQSVKPKYHLEETYRQNKPTPVDPNYKECTFTPKVKGIRPNMNSAKLYVGTNVVERLSRPLPPTTDSQGPNNGNISKSFDAAADISSYIAGNRTSASAMGSISVRGRSETPTNALFRSSFSHSAEGRLRPSSAPRERSGSKSPTLTAEERRERKKQFEEFISRQSQSAIKKRQHADEGLLSSTPSFAPHLDKKSLQIAKENDPSEFIDRMEKYLMKKQDAAERRASSSSMADNGITFAPTLTKKVDKLRSRSVQELSRGDQIRKELSIKAMESRLKREEKSSLTFKPRISKIGAHHESNLKLNEDPSKHLEQRKKKLEKRDAATNAAQISKEEADLKGCTFVPTTKECPAYIVRIADSMKMLNKARLATTEAKQIQSPQKPQWKFT